MSWKKPDVLWKACPHTIAKIELLESYLEPWFAILGRSRYKQDIVYVDGFCGPGEYSNHPTGSPMAAINAANSILNADKGYWKAGDVHLVFIDKDANSIAHLDKKLAEMLLHPRIHTRTIAKSFIEGLKEIRRELSRSFKAHHPLFVFIDPFGVKGVPFRIVAEILQSPCSEVLINLDADGIARIFQAGDKAGHEKNLREIFGDNSWRDVLTAVGSFHEKCASVLELYKRKLKSLPNVGYVFSFEMRNKSGLDYYLVFASQHPLGLKKMKSAMKKIDQTGSYQFSDAHAGQPLLFQFEHPENSAQRMHAHFSGQKVNWSVVDAYALTETPYENPKIMLKNLESKNLIQVETKSGYTRRRGQYPDGKVTAIIFVEGNDA